MERWKQGSLLAGLTLVFVAILTGVSLTVYRFPWRLDVTEGGKNSISAQTQKIVKSLKQDVWIRAFFQEGAPENRKARALFETYAYTNPHIHYQFIDPDRQPALAQQYGIRNYGALVLESGEKKQPVNAADEEGITNGLLRLMQTRAKKVIFISGHRERSIQDPQKTGYSQAKDLLVKENYQVEEINLLAGNGLPAETSCVVIAGPKKPFFPEEVEDLKKYVQAGGRVILLLEPNQDGGLKEWLASIGIGLNDDIVIDKLSRAFGGDYLIPMAGSYGSNPITEKFNVATFFPTARSLALSPSPPPRISYDVLVNSSSGSWAEFNRKEVENGQVSFDPEKDRKGPLTLAAMVTLSTPDQKAGLPERSEKEKKSPKGQIALFGDSDFAGNGYFNLAGNGDLFLNTVNYMTEEGTLISIRPAKTPVRPLTLSYAQAMVLFWVPMVFLPVLVIVVGIGVWRSRRKAR